MNFSNTLFRCSSLGHIMTEARSKSEILGETCKSHLTEVYVSIKYGRQADIQNRYIEKGLAVEEDSITLYSRVTKKFFKKNSIRLDNEFISGTPDLFTGLEIREADTIADVKSSWDIYTFFRVHTKPLNKDYFWQLQGYMWLTGAQSAKLVYCLVNTPQSIIDNEKRILFYKMAAQDESDKTYIEACKELELAMKYDDIPMKERMIEIEVQRDEVDIAKIGKRVQECREYLGQLEDTLNPSGLTIAL